MHFNYAQLCGRKQYILKVVMDSKLVSANEKIAEKAVGGYKAIETSVVGGYKKVENGSLRTVKFAVPFMAAIMSIIPITSNNPRGLKVMCPPASRRG